MTDREMRRLSRTDLLELLVEQKRELEELKARLAEAERQLRDRRITVQKAGSLADACLQLNGVFMAAQAAAEQYLENLRNASEEQP